MSERNFFAELKRRNVYRVAVAYAVVGWLLLQAASILFPTFEAPPWAMKVFVAIVFLGFPIALILAWAFELTPEGIKRTEELRPGESSTPRTGRKVTAFIVIAAIVAAALLGFQFLRPKSTAPSATEKSLPAAPAGDIPLKSIAVLPFASLSEDKANEYFAKGIQDEILTRLAKIADLKVISRTSTQRYKSSGENLPEIAKQLGVAHILEGSVQKAADSVRVNVQLIKASSDAHLWAESYDRKLSDVLQVESEVAQRIATALEAKLTGREQRDLATIGTTNAEAYDAYLRGLALESGQSDEEGERAIQSYRRAVELDPNFAVAWGALAGRESFWYFTDNRTPDQFARAKHAAETALRLQPEASEAHMGAGSFYYYCLQDFDRALSEFTQAREHAPGDSNAILMIGMVKRRQGKLDESIELQLQAAKLDPRNNDVWMNLARSYRGVRKFKEAQAMFDRALAIAPGDVSIRAEKVESYLGAGDLEGTEKALQGLPVDFRNRAFAHNITLLLFRRQLDGAIETISQQLKGGTLDPDNVFWARLDIAFLQSASGNAAIARPMLEEARRKLEARRSDGDMSLEIPDTLLLIVAALNDRDAVEKEGKALLNATANDLWRLPKSEEIVARAYAFLGDTERALPHVERALAKPSQQGLTPANLRLHPVWDKIRSDPRFQKFITEKSKP